MEYAWIHVFGAVHPLKIVRLCNDLKKINERLDSSFKLLASIKAEISLREDDTDLPAAFLGIMGIECSADSDSLYVMHCAILWLHGS